MDILKNSKQEKIFESVVFALVGLICFILSFFDIIALCYTLASFCIFIGVFFLFGFFLMIKDNNQALLTRSIVLILLGLIIIFFFEQFKQIISIVICIFLLYNAIQHFSFTLDIKTINEHYWKIDLFYSIFLFLFGIIVVILDAANVVDIYLLLKIGGGAFLFSGVTKILLLVKLHPTYNKLDK